MFLCADAAKKQAYQRCSLPTLRALGLSQGRVPHSGGRAQATHFWRARLPLPLQPFLMRGFSRDSLGEWVFSSIMLSVLDWLLESSRKEPVPKSMYSDRR